MQVFCFDEDFKFYAGSVMFFSYFFLNSLSKISVYDKLLLIDCSMRAVTAEEHLGVGVYGYC